MLPKSASEAYKVAADLAERQGGRIAGWKLGATTAETRKAFSTNEVYFGAVFESETFTVGSIGAGPAGYRLPRYRGEAEIALRLGRDLGVVEAASAIDAGAIFDAYAPALECPWSAISDLPEAGLVALLMDRCAAGALFLGAPRPLDAQMEYGLLEIRVLDRCLAAGRAETALLMSPQAAALRAVQLIGAAGHELRAGQWISTGGVSACVDLSHDTAVSLWFAGELVLTVPAGFVGR